MSAERRRAPRYPLIAEAELVELRSQMRLTARTSDVSLVGCFMNSSRSFPEGTNIRLRLLREKEAFTSLGVIARIQPMGMGVSFSEVNDDQSKILRGWLAELGRRGPAG